MELSPVASMIGFLLPAFCFIFWGGKSERDELTCTWSALAEATGLDFRGVQSDYWGSSQSPSLSGLYRGRYVEVSRLIEQQDAYDGSIPLGYTCIVVDLDNRAGCRLTFGASSLLDRIFHHGHVSSGDADFDHRFRVSAEPAGFARRAAEALASHPELFVKHHGIIQCIEAGLSGVSSRPPSIRLRGSYVSCTQSDVPAVHHQVALLNLLCDLADLADHA